MKPYYNENNISIYNGNAMNVLKEFEDNSIDTVITDPPYGLSKHSEKIIRKTMQEWLNGNEDFVHDGSGFMGNSWDGFVPPPALWKEVFRVMKHGASAFVFAGTRTQDLMAMSLRLAGFEIRDTLMWLYGSGFPKSLNIGKAVDKKLGTQYPKNIPISAKQKPEAKIWEGYGTALKPAYEPIIMAMKPLDGTYAENALKWGVAGLNIDGGRIPFKNDKYEKHKKEQYKSNEQPIGRFPANLLLDEEAAKMLDKQSGISKGGVYRGNVARKRKGFMLGEVYGKSNAPDNYGDVGGASRFFYVAKASKGERGEGNNHPTVKPAYEPIIWVMKPTDGTFVENALKWGVAGLNIDGARIPTEDNLLKTYSKSGFGGSSKLTKDDIGGSVNGRFPANILLDEEAAAMLDEQVPQTSKGYGIATKGTANGKGSIFKQGGVNPNRYDMGGLGASRFFYVAKASKGERGEGNNHPTVKPLKLIEYLFKLTEMPDKGQVYLDPFMGSGTTLVVAKKLAHTIVGIDITKEYCDIAINRIKTIPQTKTIDDYMEATA